jgi:hypothetical protein
MNPVRITLIAVFALVAAPAFAGTACYMPEQTRAEQWLRLHSELMVITVSCHHGSEGQPLPDAYAAFTRKNIHTLHEAEQTMIAHYKTTAKGSPIDALDRLRTRLGNEFGKKMADMSAPAFCALYRDKVTQLNVASPFDIDSQIRRMEITERTYAKPCGKIIVTNKGK